MTFLVQAASTQYQAGCRSLVSCSSQAVNATLGLKFHHKCRIVSEQARGNLNSATGATIPGTALTRASRDKAADPLRLQSRGGRETRLLPTGQMFLQLTLPPAAPACDMCLCALSQPLATSCLQCRGTQPHCSPQLSL